MQGLEEQSGQPFEGRCVPSEVLAAQGFERPCNILSPHRQSFGRGPQPFALP